MQPSRLVIGQHLLRRILEQCMEERPYEACGILTGKNGQVLHAYATDNAKRSPVFYEVDAVQQERALRSMAEHGDELIAIYHSHPTAPAVPSINDIRLAVHYPEAIRVIVSLAGPADVRAFLIQDGRVHPVSLESPHDTAGEWLDLRAAGEQPN
ncbi:MAG TPA: M67 family metallopeptidase [Symbiobacteriaceae bacterium]